MRSRLFLPSLLSTLFFGSLAVQTAQAQAQSEVVSVGPGYNTEVYYDLNDGVAASAPLNEWEIGFQIQGFASSIITNGGNGARLYVVPDKGYEDFGSAVDTTGMAATWKAWYNSAGSWELGAFNLDSDYNTGDFGWGSYNMSTHTVTGTKLYVIVLPNGTAQQIVIDGLSGGVYSFQYANIDGTNKTTGALTKSEFAGKNFGYYSLTQGTSVNHEPPGENWDLVFGKYIAWVGENNETPYVVTGVRSNVGVLVAEVEASDPANAPEPVTESYSDSITIIGHDWKEFNGAWVLRNNVAYFVKDQAGDIYRLYFTAFGGSSTGNITFMKEKLGISSVKDDGKSVATFGLYPNVVERGNSFNVLVSVEEPVSAPQFTLFDGAGRAVYSGTLRTSAGLQQLPVNLDLPAGHYTATLDVDGVRLDQRVIVR